MAGTIDNDNNFPVLTDFGVVNDKDFALYIEDLTALGHTWTQAQFDAFNSFVNNGIDQGWYENMAVIFPFFGDTAECMKVPLKLKFGARRYATIGDYSGYDIDTDWTQLAGVNGAKSASTPNRRYMALPFDMEELLAYINNDGYLTGATTIISAPAVTPDAVASDRLFGFNSTGMGEDGNDFAFTFKTLNGTVSMGMNRSLSYEAFVREDNNYFRLEEYEPGINYSYTGNFSDVNIYNRTVEAYKLRSAVADKLRIGVGGFPLMDINGDFTDTTKITDACTMKFWSFETAESNEELYRSAIETLFSVIKV